MKNITMSSVICLTLLAGCSSSNPGGVKLPKDAEFGLWTSKPISKVAQCIADETNGRIEGSLVISSSGAKYIIGPAQDGSSYSTQVSRFGSESAEIEKKVIECTVVNRQ